MGLPSSHARSEIAASGRTSPPRVRSASQNEQGRAVVLQRSRFARFGMTIVGTVGLLAVPVQPAKATTTITAVFLSQATLSGPLSYPCTGPNSIDPTLCPTLPTVVSDLPLADFPGSFSHPDYGHNKRTITAITSSVCLELVETNTLKAKAPVEEVVPCEFEDSAPKPGGNTISGNCGAAGGQVSVDFTTDAGAVYRLDLHFSVTGLLVAMYGHATKLTGFVQQGVASALGLAIPIPTLIPPSGNSCSAKTATVFTMIGVVNITTR